MDSVVHFEIPADDMEKAKKEFRWSIDPEDIVKGN